MSEVVLLGHPVSHSLSPAMHNAAFKALGLPHRYLLRDVEADRLDAEVARLRSELRLDGHRVVGFAGRNLQVPNTRRTARASSSE